jgi:hypothetical protein
MNAVSALSRKFCNRFRQFVLFPKATNQDLNPWPRPDQKLFENFPLPPIPIRLSVVREKASRQGGPNIEIPGPDRFPISRSNNFFVRAPSGP